MNRTTIIQTLVKSLNYKSYLEIGVAEGVNFESISCLNKVGVDPDPDVKCTHNMTSDAYFKTHDDKFDLVFIDGLHHADQVLRDIQNSLDRLNHGGTILLHDCHPPSKKAQIVPRIASTWTGDVWKAWIKTKIDRPNLCGYVVDADFGCGVIEWGNHAKINDFDINTLSWEKDQNRIDSTSAADFRMRTKRRRKVFIAGSGRAGTSVLTQILTALHLDTGFTVDKGMRKKVRAGYEIKLPQNLRDASNCPRIIKGPEQSFKLKHYLKNHLIIDHVIIPVRDFQASARSRLNAGLYWRIKNKNDLSEQVAVHAQAVGLTIEACTLFDIPFTILKYPDYLLDAPTLYSRLKPAIPELPSLEAFKKAVNQCVKPDLIH
tara:strand:- start:1923 stop:3047 length:1125 start_codon:yes stop_codon:yes gene_type:complete